jgi:hypothetical protein
MGEKPMKAFAVSINGELVCTAGIEGEFVLTAIVECVGSSFSCNPTLIDWLSLSVGALDSKKNEHIEWDLPKLTIGDEVSIRIIETDIVDLARRRHAGTNLEA